MITLKEALEDLHDRMTKQLGEKIWEIERVKGIKDKSKEWNDFAGTGAVKKKVLAKLEEELKEREKNLEVVEAMLENCRKQCNLCSGKCPQ